MTAALVAGLLAGYGIAIPVGAVATYLVGLTARTSLRIGAAGALGVATADGGYALLAVVGGHSLAAAIQPWSDPLRVASAVVLLAIAVTTGIQAVRGGGTDQPRDQQRSRPARSAGTAFATLLAITAVNPTTVVYFAALVTADRSTVASSALGGVLFVTGAFAASASWQLMLAGGGAVLGRRMTGARARLVTGLVSAVIVAVLAVRILP